MLLSYIRHIYETSGPMSLSDVTPFHPLFCWCWLTYKVQISWKKYVFTEPIQSHLREWFVSDCCFQIYILQHLHIATNSIKKNPECEYLANFSECRLLSTLSAPILTRIRYDALHTRKYWQYILILDDKFFEYWD